MTFKESITSCIGNATNFSGRAPRSEYWFFVLFNILFTWLVTLGFTGIGYALGGLDGGVIAYYISAILCIVVMFLPSLSVLVRRLHDTGHSGWWYFVSMLPLVGGIWLLVLLCSSSDDENKYGLPIY